MLHHIQKSRVLKRLSQVEHMGGARAEAPMQRGNVLPKEIAHIAPSSPVKWAAQAPSIRLASVYEAKLFNAGDEFLQSSHVMGKGLYVEG
jgi:hypothetical protein